MLPLEMPMQEKAVADLAYETRKLVEETVNQTGLGRKFQKRHIRYTDPRTERPKGANEGKVIDLVRGLRTGRR